MKYYETSPWGIQVLCACGCGEAFAEEARKGRPKRYVNPTHARKTAMKTYRARVKAGAKIWEDRQCRRYVPKSLEEAETAFQIHCEYSRVGALHCTKAKPVTSLRCPAVFYKDFECQEKLCIAYGTLLDDLMSWKIGESYQRRFTDANGFWLGNYERADARSQQPKQLEIWEEDGVYV